MQEAAQQATQQAEAAAKQAADAAKQAAGSAQQAAGAAVQAAGDAAPAGRRSRGRRRRCRRRGQGHDREGHATLGGITDKASAQAALPSLDELKGKVEVHAAQVDQLPAEGKKLLASLVSAALPPLKELAAKASWIQGAEAVKPAMDAMLAKLEAWANAPA